MTGVTSLLGKYKKYDMVYACLTVATCHLHFRQNDRGPFHLLQKYKVSQLKREDACVV